MNIKKLNQSKTKLQYVNKANPKDPQTIDIAITVSSNHNVDEQLLDKLFKDIKTLTIFNYPLVTQKD